jgi:hypothetical protein
MKNLLGFNAKNKGIQSLNMKIVIGLDRKRKQRVMAAS